MSTTKSKPTIVAAFTHPDYPGELILQDQSGRCVRAPKRFNGYSDAQFVPRNVLDDHRTRKVNVAGIDSGIRAPIKGREVRPLADNLTAQGMNRKRAKQGKPPLRDWLDDVAAVDE